MTLEDGAAIALKKFLAGQLSILDLRPYKEPSKPLVTESSVFGVTTQTTNHAANLFIKDNS